MKLTSKIAATFAVLALATAASASTITGRVDFTGRAILDSTVLISATQVLSWQNPIASDPTSDFATYITDGDSATFTSPWTFNSGPLNPLWVCGGFTFDLQSSYINTQNTSFLNVLGTGTITGNGFMATPGSWSFTITAPTGGGQNMDRFSFVSNTVAVPDGGATVAMLGLSFLGLGGVSRFVRRK